MRKPRSFAVPAALLLGAPFAAEAHGFGILYNLPVPFWLYVWGAAAALIVSFIVVGVFLAAPAGGGENPERDLSQAGWVLALKRWRVPLLIKGLAVVALLLSIATGFFGNRDPYRNFSMTAFWVMFVLAFTYFTALVGGLYSAANPWQVLARGVGRGWRRYAQGRFAYPRWLGYWPALALYLGFIWIELLAHTRPFSLAVLLTAYTLINLAGAGLVGIAAWFRYCEFFSVFFRLVSLMAPLEYRAGRLLWRRPFTGLLHERPEHVSLLVFVLAMLSSTAFDGLRVTTPWFRLFWQNAWLAEWVGRAPVTAYSLLRGFYVAFETLCLVAAPFLYLAVYLLFVRLAKRIVRSDRPLRELALDFGYTLLPIVLVYNVTHYFTLILTQGVKIVSLVSDPFGWGWNLFGTAFVFRAPFLPDLGWVWHTQVGLILFGHIVSVVLAHVVALRVFPTRRAAMLSQLPMLGLMVLFTVAGLWILAQPLQAMVSR